MPLTHFRFTGDGPSLFLPEPRVSAMEPATIEPWRSTSSSDREEAPPCLDNLWIDLGGEG
jgi:hypothetical protein